MVSILFVSISFPPKLDPECIQTSKYFKYLQKQEGLAIDVVTSTNRTAFMPHEKTMEVYDTGYRQKVLISIFENRYLNFILRKVYPRMAERPDSKYSFHWQWKKVIRRLKNKPDVLYVRTAPMSSAIMGLKLQAYYQVPMVLHLSDGWVDFRLHTPLAQSTLQYQQRMERLLYEKADRVTLTSEKTVEFYRKKYPELAQKFEYFPNVFDPEDALPSGYQFKEKLQFVYTGGFYQRDPLSLFHAIEIIKRQCPQILSEIEFTFAGEHDRLNASYFRTYSAPYIKHLGRMSYPDSLALQRQADVLMLFDTRLGAGDPGAFLPSKLLDYMLVRRKIMAVTAMDSTVHHITHKKYGQCFEYEDYEGIAQFIISCHGHFIKRNATFFVNEKPDDTFSADHHAKRLGRLIRQTAIKPSKPKDLKPPSSFHSS